MGTWGGGIRQLLLQYPDDEGMSLHRVGVVRQSRDDNLALAHGMRVTY